MARVLVYFNIVEGIMKTFNIRWGEQLLVKKLEHKGISFKCRLCRNTIHLRRKCPRIHSSEYDYFNDDQVPEDELAPHFIYFINSLPPKVSMRMV